MGARHFEDVCQGSYRYHDSAIFIQTVAVLLTLPTTHGKCEYTYVGLLHMDIQLPQELLQQIFSYLARDQKTLHACSLASSSWYLASVAYLYDNPIITGKNYDRFVRAMCPSVNAHVRRNGLADLVRRLDMSGLVHNGSKSLTARLLGRVKKRLEEFVAPQASFAYVVELISGARQSCSESLARIEQSCDSSNVLQGELPRSSLKVFQSSSPRPIPRLRNLVNDRSLTLDKPASEVGKPTPTYVPLRTESPHLNRVLHLEARLRNIKSADMLQGSSVTHENDCADSEMFDSSFIGT